MSKKPKPLDPEIAKDLASLTSREFIAKYESLGKTYAVEQVRNLRTYYDVAMTPETIARDYAARAERSRRVKVRYSEKIPDPTTPEALDEMIDAYANLKALDKRFDPRRHEVEEAIETDEPVGVVFTGDWQLGSWGVDPTLWRDDMRTLRDFRERWPGQLYAIGMGDYVSNLGILNIRGAQFRDLVRPGFQLRIVRGFFKLTRGMWLGLLAGCHDTFSEKVSDNDTIEEFVKLADTRHLWHGCKFSLTVGEEKYDLRVRHRYRYNSSLNELNSHRRQVEMEGPCDVVAHAHLHTAVSGTLRTGGKSVVMLRSGSYQIHDDYARQYVGNVKADPTFPMVIFHPKEHKVELYHSFHDGLPYLEYLLTR